MNWLRICCMVFIGLPFLNSAQEPKPADQPIVKPAGKDLVETWEAAYLSRHQGRLQPRPQRQS